MVLPRLAILRGGFRPSASRFSGSRVRSGQWRQAGRRTYADAHGPVKASSDLPWIIGSTVVTVPSAIWLWQQGPKKGGHGHDEHGEGEEHEEGGEDAEAQPEGGEEEPKEEGGEDSKDGGDDGEKQEDGGDAEKKDESKDESQSGESESEGGDNKDMPTTSEDEEGYEKPDEDAPGEINKNDKKGPGEQQKGERGEPTKQAEKDARKDESGAKNPYIDDPEKSKKGEGVTDTAKIHGTVDPKRPAR